MVKDILVNLFLKILPYISDSLREVIKNLLDRLEAEADKTDTVADNILVDLLRTLFDLDK